MAFVYIRTDEHNRIIAVNSSVFLSDTAGWIEVDKGVGDRYTHAQGNYMPLPLVTEGGAYRYAYIDGAIAERTAEEIAADEAAAVTQEPTTEDRVTELESALDLLLSGVTE